MTRVGYTTPVEGFSTSLALADLFTTLTKKRNIKAEYDLTYEGHPQNLTYTEIFVNAKGLFVKPCDTTFTNNLLRNARTNENYGYADHIIKHMDDKYSRQLDPIISSDVVVFLPGSNLINTIKPSFLRSIIEKHEFVIFKPHPLINHHDFKLLESELTTEKSYVMAPRFSGVYLLKRANVVYVPKCSELGILAKLLGKHINIIDIPTHLNSYKDFYDAMETEELHAFIESPLSGLFLDLPGVEQRMENYLDHYTQYLTNSRKLFNHHYSSPTYYGAG